MNYAIIQTGGKQYKVKAGETIQIEKIDGLENSEISLSSVLMIFDEDAKKVSLGKPELEKIRVKAKIIEHGRSKKINVVKYKPKIRYKKKYGHQQPYTKIEILNIETD